MKQSAVFVLLALVVPLTAGAQWLAESSSWVTSAPVVSTPQAKPVLLAVEPASDYRWHGLAIGFVAFAALGAWIGNDACESQAEPVGGDGGSSPTECALMLGALGGLLGAPIGFFIGKGVPRTRPE